MTSSNATTLSILNDTRRPDWRRFPDAVGYLLADIEERPNADIASNMLIGCIPTASDDANSQSEVQT